MDDKDKYSKASKSYVNNDVIENDVDAKRYERSKERERKYNSNWSEHKVNINDVVAKFVPVCRDIRSKGGVKYCYIGDRYTVVADKVAGYLRILDRVRKCYVDLNGNAGSNEETHFKILKRSEM